MHDRKFARPRLVAQTRRRLATLVRGAYLQYAPRRIAALGLI